MVAREAGWFRKGSVPQSEEGRKQMEERKDTKYGFIRRIAWLLN